MRNLKKYSLLLCLTLVLLVFCSHQIMAISLQVAPHRFVFRIDQSNTQEAVVTNISNSPLKINVYCEIVPEQAEEEYLGEWVIVYPRLLSINPGEQKVLRFSCRPPKGLKDGEYRALLFFEEIYNKKDGEESTEDFALDFQLLTKLGVNLYGQVGRIIHKGEFKNVNFDYSDNQLKVTGDLENLGNAHLLTDVTVTILDSNQQVVREEVISSFPTHRHLTEVFEYTTDLEKGNYTIKIVFVQEDTKICGYEGTFEAK